MKLQTALKMHRRAPVRATCYPATCHTEGFMQTKASLSSERWNPDVGALGVGGLPSKGQGPCRFAFKIPGCYCPAPRAPSHCCPLPPLLPGSLSCPTLVEAFSPGLRRVTSLFFLAASSVCITTHHGFREPTSVQTNRAQAGQSAGEGADPNHCPSHRTVHRLPTWVLRTAGSPGS